MSAEQLQSSLDRIAAGETVESVLRSLASDAETRALVQLALSAGEALPQRAPSAMRARQQAALQARLEAQLSPQKGRASATSGLLGLWRRWAVRLAGAAMAASLALGSAVAVSADSLPGDALYGVKRAAESARVALTVSPAARVRLRAGLAVERLSELRALVDRGVMPSPEDIERLLAAHSAMQQAAAEAGGDMLDAETAQGSKEIADGLRALAAQIADGDPSTAARLDDAAELVAPTRAAQDEPGNAPEVGDSGADGASGDHERGAGSKDEEAAPTLEPTRAIATTGAAPGSEEATAPSELAGTPTVVLSTATRTPPPSPTRRPTASATSQAGGGAPVQPTDAPQPTSAPPTAPPQPTAAPQPTSAPPTAAPATAPPPDPTAPIPNPRATDRAATSFPTSQP
jgi:hypothetical protein